MLSKSEVVDTKYSDFDELVETTFNKNYDDFKLFEQILIFLTKTVPCRYLFATIQRILLKRDIINIERLISFIEYGVKQSTNEFRISCTNVDFLEQIHGLLAYMPSQVGRKILYLVLFLKHALKNYTDEIKNVNELYNILVAEGFQFPSFDNHSSFCVPKEEVSSEPIWLDGDWCAECNSKFTTLRRKHHCRKCGNVVCNICSSEKSTIPIYNIQNTVRVCKTCFKRLTDNKLSSSSTSTRKNSQSHDNPKQDNTPIVASSQEPTQQHVDAYFEEDLKRAIELSLAEAKKNELPKVEKKKPYSTTNNSSFDYPEVEIISNNNQKTKNITYNNSTSSNLPHTSSAVSQPYSINLIQKDQKYNQTTNINSASFIGEQQSVESILSLFHKNIHTFEQRCQYLRHANQPFSKDYYLQGVLQTLLISHVQIFEILSINSKEIDDLNMQLTKLDLIKEARKTLDDLKREHMDKLRQQKEEADMFLRIQMEQKMELTRQQKKEVEDIQNSLKNKLRFEIDTKLNSSIIPNKDSFSSFDPTTHHTTFPTQFYGINMPNPNEYNSSTLTQPANQYNAAPPSTTATTTFYATPPATSYLGNDQSTYTYPPIESQYNIALNHYEQQQPIYNVTQPLSSYQTYPTPSELNTTTTPIYPPVASFNIYSSANAPIPQIVPITSENINRSKNLVVPPLPEQSSINNSNTNNNVTNEAYSNNNDNNKMPNHLIDFEH